MGERYFEYCLRTGVKVEEGKRTARIFAWKGVSWVTGNGGLKWGGLALLSFSATSHFIAGGLDISRDDYKEALEEAAWGAGIELGAVAYVKNSGKAGLWARDRMEEFTLNRQI